MEANGTRDAIVLDGLKISKQMKMKKSKQVNRRTASSFATIDPTSYGDMSN